MPLLGISNANNFLHLGPQTKDLEGVLKLAFPIIHIPIRGSEMNVLCYWMILIKGFVSFVVVVVFDFMKNLDTNCYLSDSHSHPHPLE